jgi:16S rRNA (guanine527-N7)-methyltransferase
MSADERPEAADLPQGFWDAVGLTPQRHAKAKLYRDMLETANRETNLVGASTLPQFWTRHFLDSAQLLWFAPHARTWADLGAGAGLPGLVLAILLDGREGAHVHLVESMAKRCRFLQSVVERLDLPASVTLARAEETALRVDRVTARACAPLDRLLDFAAPSLRLDGEALFLKGTDVDAEVAAARRHWRFTARCETSLSDPRGRVLSVRDLSRVSRR